MFDFIESTFYDDPVKGHQYDITDKYDRCPEYINDYSAITPDEFHGLEAIQGLQLLFVFYERRDGAPAAADE